jgi:hypothetical protein
MNGSVKKETAGKKALKKNPKAGAPACQSIARWRDLLFLSTTRRSTPT